MRASRVDLTQAEIVDALRRVGAFVWICSRLGDGFPDLFVVFRELAYLLECKSPGGRLTGAEQRFIAMCPIPVHVVHTADEALRVIGAMRKGVE